jgi:hypothetical protein
MFCLLTVQLITVLCKILHLVFAKYSQNFISTEGEHSPPPTSSSSTQARAFRSTATTNTNIKAISLFKMERDLFELYLPVQQVFFSHYKSITDTSETDFEKSFSQKPVPNNKQW